MGYAGVFWSCASLYLVAKTLKDAFTELARDGTSDAFLSRMIDFNEFNHFIGLDRYRELEKRYASDDNSQPCWNLSENNARRSKQIFGHLTD